MKPDVMERGMQDQVSAQREQLDALLSEFEGPLLRYTVSITHDLENARDVVQDAFIRYFQTAGKEEIECPGPWLYRVCHNRALDLLRKQKRLLPLGDEADKTEAPTPDPSQAAAEEADRVSVLEILGRLPSRQQQVVPLRFQGGLSYKDISAATQLSVSNVGYILHEAIRRIRCEVRKMERLALSEPVR